VNQRRAPQQPASFQRIRWSLLGGCYPAPVSLDLADDTIRFRSFWPAVSLKRRLIQIAQGCSSHRRIDQSQQEPMSILKTTQVTKIKWVSWIVRDALQYAIEHVAYGFEVL
jgi:hypothetical protein